MPLKTKKRNVYGKRVIEKNRVFYYDFEQPFSFFIRHAELQFFFYWVFGTLICFVPLIFTFHRNVYKIVKANFGKINILPQLHGLFFNFYRCLNTVIHIFFKICKYRLNLANLVKTIRPVFEKILIL